MEKSLDKPQTISMSPSKVALALANATHFCSIKDLDVCKNLDICEMFSDASGNFFDGSNNTPNPPFLSGSLRAFT